MFTQDISVYTQQARQQATALPRLSFFLKGQKLDTLFIYLLHPQKPNQQQGLLKYIFNKALLYLLLLCIYLKQSQPKFKSRWLNMSR